jgi:hypothetical protein
LINFSGCILDVFPREKVGNDVRFALAAAEVAPDLAHQLRLVARALTTQGIAFDILIEQFIRVELRAIAGQEDQPNPGFIFLDPVFNPAGAMHRVTVNNEIEPARTLAEQTPEKFQENLGRKGFFEDHKVQAPLVGNGGNHIAAKALAGG